MPETNIVNDYGRIADEFYPSVYPEKVYHDDWLKLILTRSNGLGRYCIAVFEVDDIQAIEQVVRRAKRRVLKETKALWMFREVGVFIVIHSKTPVVITSASSIPVDRTGFHSVIVQGVHVIDSENKHVYNHAKWGNHTHGGANVLSRSICQLYV